MIFSPLHPTAIGPQKLRVDAFDFIGPVRPFIPLPLLEVIKLHPVFLRSPIQPPFLLSSSLFPAKVSRDLTAYGRAFSYSPSSPGPLFFGSFSVFLYRNSLLAQGAERRARPLCGSNLFFLHLSAASASLSRPSLDVFLLSEHRCELRCDFHRCSLSSSFSRRRSQ